jgi:ABC-type oligopeptide transport system substrate-binding subunit
MKGTVVRRANLVTALGLVVLCLALSACGGSSDSATPVQPAQLTKLAGGVNQITLTADAAKRIDLKTAAAATDGGNTVIPYAAVLYDPDGATWTYTNPKPLVFVRADITVDRIEGERAILTKGPAAGTAVVTVGATELWGVEYGGIEED